MSSGGSRILKKAYSSVHLIAIVSEAKCSRQRVLGHAPLSPGKFWISDLLRSFLVLFWGELDDLWPNLVIVFKHNDQIRQWVIQLLIFHPKTAPQTISGQEFSWEACACPSRRSSRALVRFAKYSDEVHTEKTLFEILDLPLIISHTPKNERRVYMQQMLLVFMSC